MANCEGNGPGRKRLNRMLIGEQPVGTWVLAFQGNAMKVMTADEARAIPGYCYMKYERQKRLPLIAAKNR